MEASKDGHSTAAEAVVSAVSLLKANIGCSRRVVVTPGRCPIDNPKVGTKILQLLLAGLFLIVKGTKLLLVFCSL